MSEFTISFFAWIDFAIQAQWNDLFGYCLMNSAER